MQIANSGKSTGRKADTSTRVWLQIDDLFARLSVAKRGKRASQLDYTDALNLRLGAIRVKLTKNLINTILAWNMQAANRMLGSSRTQRRCILLEGGKQQERPYRTHTYVEYRVCS